MGRMDYGMVGLFFTFPSLHLMPCDISFSRIRSVEKLHFFSLALADA